jgi:Sec-independent protein secretion pathway component TatC
MPVPAAKEEPKDEDPAESMSLKGHLTELRSRLIKSALSILVVFIGLFSFAPYIRGMLGKVLKAVLPPGGAITFVDINRGLHCGHASGLCPELLCGQPVHLLPDLGVYRPCGLYDSERKCVVPLALCSALLFIAGGAF